MTTSMNAANPAQAGLDLLNLFDPGQKHSFYQASQDFKTAIRAAKGRMCKSKSLSCSKEQLQNF